MTHTTAHTYCTALLLLTLILPACTPKNTATPQTAADTLQLLEKCSNGDQQACNHLKALADQYDKDHPCTYVRSRIFEDKINLPQITQGDISYLDALILEAKANNYGDCQQHSSLATMLRFIKGFKLYIAKDYSHSAKEFETALGEISDDNLIDSEFTTITIALYPAALIKSGDIPKAKQVLETPLYTPIKNLAGDNTALILPFLKHGGELLRVPQPQNYSFATLACAGIIKGPHPPKPFALDVFKTLAPYTPVPKFILEYKE